MIASIVSLLGLALRVPDHTTLSRRSATLTVPRPQPDNAGADDGAQSQHLLVDSTGLKLCGTRRPEADLTRAGMISFGHSGLLPT
jgi:Transposase DDE domain